MIAASTHGHGQLIVDLLEVARIVVEIVSSALLSEHIARVKHQALIEAVLNL